MESFFPYLEGIDYTKLFLTHEGTYSVTRRAESAKIIGWMRSIVENIPAKTITDTTACVGGDTINFSLHYKKVYSIEINPENFKVLENNVDVFGCKNIELYCGDSTKLTEWYSDVVYIDPPWGGPSYRNVQNIQLFVGKKRLDDWIENIASAVKHPSYIFLKVPFNYNPILLAFVSNFQEMKEIRIHNFFMICIKLKNDLSV